MLQLCCSRAIKFFAKATAGLDKNGTEEHKNHLPEPGQFLEC